MFCSNDTGAQNDTGAAQNVTLPDAFELLEETRFFIQRVLVPLVFCIGVLGNSVTIVVLTRRKMRNNTNLYLTALATSDLLYLVFIFTLSFKHYPYIKNVTYVVYWQYLKYAMCMADAFSNTSVWLTVTFTIERWIAVSDPIKGKMFCTQARAKKAIALIYFLCIGSAVPTVFEWTHCLTETEEATQVKITYTQFGQNDTYRIIFYWYTSIVFILLPLSLLAVFNTFLIVSVRRSRNTRKKLTQAAATKYGNRQSSDQRITIMLIAVVVLFMLCQLPTAGMLIYSLFHEPPPNTTAFAVMLILGNIFNFLMAINASCNFILYCALSKQYRKTFIMTFFPCLSKLPSPSHSIYGTRNTTTIEDDFVSSPTGRSPKMNRTPSAKNRNSVSFALSLNRSYSAKGYNVCRQTPDLTSELRSCGSPNHPNSCTCPPKDIISNRNVFKNKEENNQKKRLRFWHRRNKRKENNCELWMLKKTENVEEPYKEISIRVPGLPENEQKTSV